MINLSATINCADEHVPVTLSPALRTMGQGPLPATQEPRQITLMSLIDVHTLEPALYHNPYFVHPADDQNQFIHFLQALRYTDQYALASISGHNEPCLLYPYKDYLMLVLITSDAELIEPEDSDWAIKTAEIPETAVSALRKKMESLNYPAARAQRAGR